MPLSHSVPFCLTKEIGQVRKPAKIAGCKVGVKDGTHLAEDCGE